MRTTYLLYQLSENYHSYKLLDLKGDYENATIIIWLVAM